MKSDVVAATKYKPTSKKQSNNIWANLTEIKCLATTEIDAT